MPFNKLCALFLASSAIAASAQVIASLTSWRGVQVYFDARLEPPPRLGSDASVRRQLAGGVIVNNQVHRYWRDAAQGIYVGYDLEISSADSRVLQIHILPLSLTPQQLVEHGFPGSWTRLSLPKYPVIPEVRAGDTLAIDLMVNPKTGQKLVDYLTIQPNGPAEPSRARDFTLEDVGLALNRPRLSINGTLVEATAHEDGGISGAPVWFYLRGQGRFVLSLIPGAGSRLKRAGEVSDNVLTFRDGADTFRLECSGPIVSTPGHYNIYLYRDRNWRPLHPEDDAPFVFGSAPLQNLLGNQ